MTNEIIGYILECQPEREISEASNVTETTTRSMTSEAVTAHKTDNLAAANRYRIQECFADWEKLYKGVKNPIVHV